ncbi:MMPL family transporter [Oerskovia paurometabola]|uniref:MMPL family transporter n=1 Tax=Oerskovia paurometabola TaxID=162170 RepID=A0ABW1XCD9_9CELL|nr:MMPL family transporter [Oerskovia paurometabola]MBM7496609.1 RND superfamily putative drug exporter [Oerskovia paurometabola]
MLAHLGRVMARHRIAVLALWGVLALLGAVIGGGVFDRTTTVDSLPPGAPSARAQALLDELDPQGETLTAVVGGVDFFTPSLVESGSRVMHEVREMPGVLEVSDAFTSGGLISDDGLGSLVVVELDPDLTDEQALEVGDRVAAALQTIDAPEVVVGGELMAERTFADIATADAVVGESVALVVLCVVLVLVLGGLRAGLAPIVAALASIAASLLALSALAGAVPVSEFAVNVVTLLGLGLAVDYSLLVIVRFREEREAAPGAPLEELLARTVSTAGRAVLVSGLAVASALGGLLVLADPLLASMALGGLLVVALTTLAGLTLVPALVAVLRASIPAARTRTWARRRTGRGSGLLARSAAFAQRRPVAVTLGSTAVLLLLSAPLASLALGASDARSLPPGTPERVAQERIEQDFEILGVQPVELVLGAPVEDPGVQSFLDAVYALPGVEDVEHLTDFPPDVTVAEVTPVGTATDETAQAVVRDVRALDVPFSVQVAGPAAELVDATQQSRDRLPWAFAVVVLPAMLLLGWLTRSVVVPLKALVLNLLALTASLGVLVAVFQWGWGARFLGFEPTGTIDATSPALLFVFLFGLSMDYEVFLLARIAEEWRRRTGDDRRANDRAVLAGIVASGPVITVAAVSIGIVFAGFALGDLVAMKEIGVGMAVAVLLDVTIVRGLLLPASMSLLGRWNWWFPGARTRHGLGVGPDEVRGEEPSPRTLVGSGTSAGAGRG